MVQTPAKTSLCLPGHHLCPHLPRGRLSMFALSTNASASTASPARAGSRASVRIRRAAGGGHQGQHLLPPSTPRHGGYANPPQAQMPAGAHRRRGAGPAESGPSLWTGSGRTRARGPHAATPRFPPKYLEMPEVKAHTTPRKAKQSTVKIREERPPTTRMPSRASIFVVRLREEKPATKDPSPLSPSRHPRAQVSKSNGSWEGPLEGRHGRPGSLSTLPAPPATSSHGSRGAERERVSGGRGSTVGPHPKGAVWDTGLGGPVRPQRCGAWEATICVGQKL